MSPAGDVGRGAAPSRACAPARGPAQPHLRAPGERRGSCARAGRRFSARAERGCLSALRASRTDLVAVATWHPEPSLGPWGASRSRFPSHTSAFLSGSPKRRGGLPGGQGTQGLRGAPHVRRGSGSGRFPRQGSAASATS